MRDCGRGRRRPQIDWEAAFAFYVELDWERSYATVAERFGVSLTAVKEHG